MASLNQSNDDYFLTFFNAIPAPAFTVNEDVRIQNCNRVAFELFGPFDSAVLDKRGGEVLHCVHHAETPEGCGHSPDCGRCVIRNSVNEAMQGSNVFRRPTSVDLINGRVIVERDLMVTASPFRFGDRGHVLLVLEDVTDRKRSEAIRLDWQRLRDVIEMIDAEISEMNRPLSSSAETVQYLQGLDAPADSFRERVAVLDEALEQCRTIIRTIRRLTRLEPGPDTGVATIIDLDEDAD